MDEKPREERRLQPARFHMAEHQRMLYVVQADIGTELADLLNPGYWANFAGRLRPWDRIEVRADDGSWYAEVMVLDCSRNWAKVHVLRHERLTDGKTSQIQTERLAAVQAVLATHEVIHRGPRGWSVVRRNDRAVIQEGLNSKEDATDWLATFANRNLAPRAAATPAPEPQPADEAGPSASA